jgi:hypothetical protein
MAVIAIVTHWYVIVPVKQFGPDLVDYKGNVTMTWADDRPPNLHEIVAKACVSWPPAIAGTLAVVYANKKSYLFFNRRNSAQ